MEKAFRIKGSLTLKDIWGVSWEMSGSAVSAKLIKGQALTTEEIAAVNSSRALVSPSSTASERAGPPGVTGTESRFYLSPFAHSVIARFYPQLSTELAVEFVHERTGKSYGKHYILYLPNCIDCIDYERSTFLRGKGHKSALESGFCPAQGSRLVLRGANIKSHIWRAEPVRSCLTFISTELKNALVAEKIKGWRYEVCDVAG
jgi:hypothetical protein